MPVMDLLEKAAHDSQHPPDTGPMNAPGFCERDPVQRVAQVGHDRLSSCTHMKARAFLVCLGTLSS
jgi:hypothetical protein